MLIVVEVVTGQLAPDPPCEQGLTVVGGGCWGAVSSTSSPRTWRCKQNPPYEQFLIDVGAVSLVVGTIGHRCRHSTHDPPHKQLFMRLGAGGASPVAVLAGTGVPSLPAAVEGISSPTCVLPHEQLLVGLQWVVVGSSSAGHTLDPPYEQLLVRLGGVMG